MKGRLPLAEAETIAQSIRRWLLDTSGAFSRVEIAGSIRRRKPTVGDIELVAELDLEFGAMARIQSSLRAARVQRADPTVRKDGVIVKAPWGDRYMKGVYVAGDDRVQIDLFMVRPPAEWGPVFLIRTGAAIFSKMMVTRLHRYNMVCSEGRILRREAQEDVVVPCPTEERFFELVHLPFIPPERRDFVFPETAVLLAGEPTP